MELLRTYLEPLVLVPSIACVVVGVVLGRWWAIALPLAGWLVWGVGIAQGWWGHGFGDTPLLPFVYAFPGIVGAGLGVTLRKFAGRLAT